MKTIYITIVAAQLYAWTASGQAFTNLNFESARIPSGTQPGAELPTSAALPGWSASSPIIPPPDIFYDAESLGGAIVSINDSKPEGINFTPLQGNYSVLLFAGPDIGAAGASSISQTGLVPLDTHSILMEIAFPFGAGPTPLFTVTLGAQQIDMTPLATFTGYTVYGGSIGSSLAGQMEALTITQFPPAPPIVPPSDPELDDIVFSPNTIPEPGTWALMLCGLALFVVRLLSPHHCQGTAPKNPKLRKSGMAQL